MKQNKSLIIFIITGLTISCILNLVVIFNNGAINDEFAAHITGGYLYWKTGKFAGGVNNPPLGQLWVALPIVISGKPLSPFSAQGLWLARLANLILAEILIFWIFYQGVKIFGAYGGLISFSVAILSPDLMAHSTLATLEIPSTLALWASTITFWNFLKKPVMKNVLWFGLFLGIAFCVKINALYLPIIFFFLIMLLVSKKQGRQYLSKCFNSTLKHPFKLILNMGIIIFLFLLVICLCYHFQGFGSNKMFIIEQKLPDFPKSLKNILSFITYPFPNGFIEATIGKIVYSQKGNFSYLLGHRSMKGWWWYYPVILLLKMPVPILIGVALSLVISLRTKRISFLFPWVFPIVYLSLAILTNKSQIGLRHLLPMYPFLFLALGSLSKYLKKRLIPIWIIGGIWLVISLFSVFPYPLTYENLFTFRNGYKWMVDANYDWGQANRAIEYYKRNHKLTNKTSPYQVTPGTIILRVNEFNGFGDLSEGLYQWLRPFKPVRKVARVGLVFNISDTQINQLRELAKDNSWIALSLANYYGEINKHKQAEELFKTALQLTDHPAIVLFYRGKYKISQNEYLNGYRDLRKASQIEPENQDIQKEFLLCEKLIEALRLQESNLPLYYLKMANIQILKFEYEKAEESLNNAERMGIPRDTIVQTRFWLYSQSGQWEKVLNLYEKTNERQRNDIPTVEFLKKCLNKTASAEEMLEFANFCFINQLWVEAAKYYMIALEKNPSCAQAANYFGQIIVLFVQQSVPLSLDQIKSLKMLTFNL